MVASFGLPWESLHGVRRAFELPWEADAATIAAVVAGFLAVKPDYAHPTHKHDDLVAVATSDFLALALIVVAVLDQSRRRRLRD